MALPAPLKKLAKLAGALFLVALTAACASGPSTSGSRTAAVSSSQGLEGYEETGMASWYGDKYHGLTTASGQAFDMNAMTAAHKTLPFGTVVTVTSLSNGRSVRVTINDRGPFAKGRIIDLSRRAASELGFLNDGVTQVRVKVQG